MLCFVFTLCCKMGEEIDNEILISLVMARPVLWDKTLDIYKDRVATRTAWGEVCLELNPGFDELEDKEKNTYGKELVRRWGNLRDAYAKSKKKIQESKRSGAGGKKPKTYIFNDQLSFLEKLYDSRATVDSLNTPEPESTEHENSVEPVEREVDERLVRTDAGETTPLSTSRSRKQRKLDEVELKILKALEPPKQNSKMSFFEGILPHLEKFDENDMLQFQMGVLQVIANINDRKNMISHPNVYHQTNSMPQTHQNVSHQFTSMAHQTTLMPQTNHHIIQPWHTMPQPTATNCHQIAPTSPSVIYRPTINPNIPKFQSLYNASSGASDRNRPQSSASSIPQDVDHSPKSDCLTFSESTQSSTLEDLDFANL